MTIRNSTANAIFTWTLNSCSHSEDLHQILWFRAALLYGKYFIVYHTLCKPGSLHVTNAFFENFDDLLERLATCSAPSMIVGDFNIHMDVAGDDDASKLSDILVSHGLSQHVKSVTHRQGHTLDLIITRDGRSIHTYVYDRPTTVVWSCSHNCRLCLSIITRYITNVLSNSKLAWSW